VCSLNRFETVCTADWHIFHLFFVCRSIRRKNNLNLVLRCRAASTDLDSILRSLIHCRALNCGFRYTFRAIVQKWARSVPPSADVHELSLLAAGSFWSETRTHHLACQRVGHVIGVFLNAADRTGANWYRQELKDGMTLSELAEKKTEK